MSGNWWVTDTIAEYAQENDIDLSGLVAKIENIATYVEAGTTVDTIDNDSVLTVIWSRRDGKWRVTTEGKVTSYDSLVLMKTESVGMR